MAEQQASRRSAATIVFPSFGWQIAAGMAIGLVLGLVGRSIGPAPGGDANSLVQMLDFAGDIFIQLLKLLVPPLVFAAIVASIANLRDLNNAARLVWQTLLWFAITALIAVLIGIALGVILQPGVNSGVDAASAAPPRSVGGWFDFVKGLVPVNILALSASTKLPGGGSRPARRLPARSGQPSRLGRWQGPISPPAGRRSSVRAPAPPH